MSIYKLDIFPNEGYGAAAPARQSVTVGELREMLEALDDDDIIVTHDCSNGRGANYGYIIADGYLEEVEDEDDEDE